jgi:CelD/BcsL family acetyltransferase involved in cellulose biosynthesis
MLYTAPIEDTPLLLKYSDDLADFAGIWPAMGDRGPSRNYVFQTADFLDVWSDTVGKARGTRPFFVAVVDDSGTPHALFPLGIERRQFGVRVLTFLDGGVSDYNAPVLYPEVKSWDLELTQKLWRAIVRIAPPFDIAVVEKMPERVFDIDNPLMPLVTARYPDSGHVMHLPGNVAEFVSKRLPRAQDTRRKLRRLGERGKLEFRVARTPAERNDFVAAMMRQKSRRYVETRGADGFERPGYRAFFRDAAFRLAPQGLVHLSALTLDGAILAAHWGYHSGGRFYYMMPSFEGGEWDRYSPGRHLLNNLIELAIKDGVEIFDHGIGDEGYKDEYCDLKMDLYQIEVSRTLLGRAALLSRRARSSLRGTPTWELLKRLRVRWRKSGRRLVGGTWSREMPTSR